MKCFLNGFFLCALVCLCADSYAQNSIFAGKIVDENERAVAGAVVKVTGNGMTTETRSTVLGLFYTKMIPDGKYKVEVKRNGKYLKGKKIVINEVAPGKEKTYYILKLSKKKMKVSETQTDVFRQTALNGAESQPGVDYPKEFIRIDSSGKIQDFRAKPKQVVPLRDR